MDECCDIEVKDLQRKQKLALFFALLINVAFFFGEGIAGFVAQSSSLLADAVDMGGDALVYCLSLIAITHTMKFKSKVAIFSSGFELILGIVVLVETTSKFFREVEPISSTMFFVGSLALLGNLTAGFFLVRHKDQDINMKAVWLCTRNDILNNFFTLLAAGGVFLTHAKWPDLVAGYIIAGLIVFFAVRVLRESFLVHKNSQKN